MKVLKLTVVLSISVLLSLALCFGDGEEARGNTNESEVETDFKRD